MIEHPDEPAGPPSDDDHPAPGQAPERDLFEGEPWQGAARSRYGSTGGSGRARRRVSRRRLRRRRRVGLGLVLVGLPLLLATAWMVVTGLLARHALDDVRHDVQALRDQLSAGRLDDARTLIPALSRDARRAHDLTTGPAWFVSAHLPGGAGDPFVTIRTITSQLDSLTHTVLPQFLTISAELEGDQVIRPGARIDLSRVASLTPRLTAVADRLAGADTAIGRAPSATWLGPADTARRMLLGQLRNLSSSARSAVNASRLAPELLGGDGVRRYFVAFQNEAEARGTGGVPGAFAILRADHGKLSFERFESDSALGVVPTRLNFGHDYAAQFHDARSTSLYVNSNLSPHFPYAAQIWTAMWRKHSGQRVDGAIAVDPTVLAYLLQVTGPTTLPDGTTLSASNVVALTQNRVYFRYPTFDAKVQAARKTFLVTLARAASTHILASRVDPVRLLHAGAIAAGQRRILVYSATPAVESQLEQSSLSGAVPTDHDAYAGLSIVNDAGNKLDYYLERGMTWQASNCGETREVTVTVTLHNATPAGALPPYLAARSDRRPYRTAPGDNRELMSYYATHGAQLTGVTVQGRTATASIDAAFGHPVYTVDVEIPRGQTRTVVLHLLEPNVGGTPQTLRQPLVRPLDLAVHGCG